MQAAPKSAYALSEFEETIDARVADYGREMYRRDVQPVADALPKIGSDGKPLLEGRTVSQQVLTRYGVVELNLFSGRCQTTGRFEMPFKTLYCRGERHPVSPLLEQGREASGRLTRSTRRHEDTEVFKAASQGAHPPCAKRRYLSSPCLRPSVTSALTGRRPGDE